MSNHSESRRRPADGRRLATAARRQQLADAADQLAAAVDDLMFSPPITHVYNPLTYARQAHHQYLQWAQPETVEVLFLGMNPGPWGMAQTGVPFGQVAAVVDWLQIDAPIGQPPMPHPKRPVQGLACPRSEVSGQRLWGGFRERFGTPEAFFQRHFVVNYCPLVFMEAGGRNFTPDKLPLAERQPLTEICDRHLRQVLGILQPRYLVGVGGFAEQCCRRVTATLPDHPPAVCRILHPSPASPKANRGWFAAATAELVQAGVWPA